MGLQSQNFQEFARVGSVKKIAKPILRNVLHYSKLGKSAEEHDAAAIREMKEMLLTCDPEGAKDIHRAIAELKSQQSERRAATLKTRRVVGETQYSFFFFFVFSPLCVDFR